ncbi:MAG: prepilin peptidase [Erysipelotrichaceae bacterium]|nr:prepilin peptidase [Erysipelotrichaceae bacterium]
MFMYIIVISLITGSFIQCLIDRYPNYFINNYSFCDNCKNHLKYYDLIPIFSYINLKGKCRYCKKEISPIKLLSESIFLVMYIFLYLNYKNYLFFQLLFIALYLASFVDIKHKEIPDLSIFIIIFIIIYFKYHQNYLLSIYIVIIGSILSYLNLIGFGDIKLLSVLSYFIDLNNFILALFISSFSTLLYLILTKQYKKGAVIYFAPFISISYFIIILIVSPYS